MEWFNPFQGSSSGGGGGGTTNYNALTNKPQISGVTLQGNVSLTDIGVINYDDTEVRDLIANKVDKVAGKQLSSEDYTLEEKTKLASLSNYDDTTIRALISTKQDSLTFDATPTESSTNPVTSGGIYSSQQVQDSVIAFATNAGAKNLLNVTATSTGGVIINSDGTITINGTYGFVSITLGSVTLKPGRYVLSSGVNMPNLFYLTVQVEEDGERYSCRQGTESISFDVPQEMTLHRVWFSTTNGASADNVTIRPMIRHAEIADDTFVPYAPTNRELYEMFNAISQSEYDALTTKTLPLYFVYEDDTTSQTSNSASLMSASPLMTNAAGNDVGEVEEAATESDFSFKSDEGANSTFDFFSEEES